MSSLLQRNNFFHRCLSSKMKVDDFDGLNNKFQLKNSRNALVLISGYTLMSRNCQIGMFALADDYVLTHKGGVWESHRPESTGCFVCYYEIGCTDISRFQSFELVLDHSVRGQLTVVTEGRMRGGGVQRSTKCWIMCICKRV